MNDNQVIPEAAVEAAAKAYFELSTNQYMPWEQIDGAYRNAAYVFPMRAALEAAAPHIMALTLEDAAADLDDKRLLSKAFHVFYPEWLRERAAKLVPK